jgi:hypothetical protein
MILHFCGHGDGQLGLAFENDTGLTHATSAEPLTKLLHNFKNSLKCVVLNACYSAVQANSIRQQIDYVIGMSQGIGDAPATKFSTAFYDAVFAGTTFRMAFDIACTAIDLSQLPQSEVPVFFAGPAVGNTTVQYTAMIPAVEDLLLAYMNTPHAERYTYTTKGAAIKEQMARYYGDKLHTRIDSVTVVSTNEIAPGYWNIRVHLHLHGHIQQQFYCVNYQNNSAKVEWEASVGYWSTPPKVYLAFGTREPIIARVIASLDHSYYGEYRERARIYQSLELKLEGGRSFHGYVERSLPHGKKILEILSDGNKHRLTLAIGNSDAETQNVCVIELLSETWLFGLSGSP